MKHKLGLMLVTQYPKLYSNFTEHSFECGDGWFNLLAQASAAIEKELEVLPDSEHFYAVQVKEKFGSLRFYMSFSNEKIDKIVDEAETLSETTCEECGDPGEIVETRGWYSNRCVKCRS